MSIKEMNVTLYCILFGGFNLIFDCINKIFGRRIEFQNLIEDE